MLIRYLSAVIEGCWSHEASREGHWTLESRPGFSCKCFHAKVRFVVKKVLLSRKYRALEEVLSETEIWLKCYSVGRLVANEEE